LTQDDASTFLSNAMIVTQTHTHNLANRGKNRVLPKNGTAEVTIGDEPPLGTCKIELEKHVLRVSEPSFGGKLHLCLNFDLYQFSYRFTGTFIVLSASDKDKSQFFIDIESSQIKQWQEAFRSHIEGSQGYKK